MIIQLLLLLFNIKWPRRLLNDDDFDQLFPDVVGQWAVYNEKNEMEINEIHPYV